MMSLHQLSLPGLAALVLLLAACAPAPIYKPSPGTLKVMPKTVAQAPERYAGANVIWGGRVIKVTNLAHTSEIELLAYPLDSSQRPQTDATPGGRFIVVVQGYIEPLNYPPGRLLTVSGHLQGTRAGDVGAAAYVFPLVAARQFHLWTAAELRSAWSNVHVGVGVGGSF